MAQYQLQKQPTVKQSMEISAMMLECCDRIKDKDELGMKVHLGQIQGYLLGAELLDITDNENVGDPMFFQWLSTQMKITKQDGEPDA